MVKLNKLLKVFVLISLLFSSSTKQIDATISKESAELMTELSTLGIIAVGLSATFGYAIFGNSDNPNKVMTISAVTFITTMIAAVIGHNVILDKLLQYTPQGKFKRNYNEARTKIARKLVLTGQLLNDKSEKENYISKIKLLYRNSKWPLVEAYNDLNFVITEFTKVQDLLVDAKEEHEKEENAKAKSFFSKVTLGTKENKQLNEAEKHITDILTVAHRRLNEISSLDEIFQQQYNEYLEHKNKNSKN